MAKEEEEKPPPSSEWIAAFQSAMAEPATMRKVLAFARRRVFLLRKVGVGVDVDADDLAHGVVVDTACGVLTWDPSRVALSTHLCQAIKSRTHKTRTRRKPAETEDVIDEVVSAQENDPVGEIVALREVLAKTKDYLFRVAVEKDDEAVQLLLMAYEDGVEGRSELGEATDLAPNDVTNARKRLDRYINCMPDGLAVDARKALN